MIEYAYFVIIDDILVHALRLHSLDVTNCNRVRSLNNPLLLPLCICDSQQSNIASDVSSMRRDGLLNARW